MENPYTKEYYQALREGARRSAEAIVPLVMGLLHPRSVIDVGCGDGTWLSVFRQFGAREILGIDREYVTGEILEIPEKEFLPHDLRLPLSVDREFHLVLSLEVAEHLPPECAETFVDSLTHLGPAVLFSAAIPFQGGTDHVNEQWPDYWVELFGKKGFVAIDPIRKHVWQNADVESWYSQNVLLFVKRQYLEERPELQAERKAIRDAQLSIVHPRMFMEMAGKQSEAFRKYEIFSAEAEKNREEADRHRKTADHCVSEVVKYKAEMEVHRAKTEHFIAEAESYREEAAAHREKAEHYIAEAEKWKSEMETHRAKAEHYFAEAERYRVKADPRNMSFMEVVKALPAVIAGAFRRDAAKRSMR